MDKETGSRQENSDQIPSILNRVKDSRFKIIYICAAAVALFLIIPFLAGYFSTEKIDSKPVHELAALDASHFSIAKAEKKAIAETNEAVGTVRPRTETRIEAQVTGKVLKVNVKPGDNVKRGDLLVSLENNEYRARLERSRQELLSAQSRREQARQGIEATQAEYNRAESQYRRMKKLFDDKVSSERELEQAEADFLRARAELTRSKEGLEAAESGVKQVQKLIEEARISLDYTEIRALEDAEIAMRLVEPGDLAVPGKPLLVVQTIGAMRLEAFVRETLIQNIHIGEELNVSIGTSENPVTGFVEEIVPSADPKTRSFLVKVGLPHIGDLYPGMFGRLIIPSGTRQAVVIPSDSVVRVGQLETVYIDNRGRWEKIYIKTGKRIGNMIEVLSGLDGDETVAIFENKDV